MIALVRGEMIKVRTTRTALGFALSAVLLVLAFVLLKGSIIGAAGALGGAESDEVSWAGALLVLSAWAGVFMLAGLLVDARRDVD